MEPILKWITRFKVPKSRDHVDYYDLMVDKETGVEYFANNGNLCPRVDQDGRPMVNEELASKR